MVEPCVELVDQLADPGHRMADAPVERVRIAGDRFDCERREGDAETSSLSAPQAPRALILRRPEGPSRRMGGVASPTEQARDRRLGQRVGVDGEAGDGGAAVGGVAELVDLQRIDRDDIAMRLAGRRAGAAVGFVAIVVFEMMGAGGQILARGVARAGLQPARVRRECRPRASARSRRRRWARRDRA